MSEETFCWGRVSISAETSTTDLGHPSMSGQVTQPSVQLEIQETEWHDIDGHLAWPGPE